MSDIAAANELFRLAAREQDPLRKRVLNAQAFTLIDAQQTRVYRAGRELRALFDGAVESGCADVKVNGLKLSLPEEYTFDTIADVQGYIDEVTAMDTVVNAFGRLPVPRVRARRGRYGARKAHYQRGDEPVIAMPNGADRWAMREIVVLHELGHHFTPKPYGGHGPAFVTAFHTLLELVMGADTATAAEVIFATNGVLDRVLPYGFDEPADAK